MAAVEIHKASSEIFKRAVAEDKKKFGQINKLFRTTYLVSVSGASVVVDVKESVVVVGWIEAETDVSRSVTYCVDTLVSVTVDTLVSVVVEMLVDTLIAVLVEMLVVVIVETDICVSVDVLVTGSGVEVVVEVETETCVSVDVLVTGGGIEVVVEVETVVDTDT